MSQKKRSSLAAGEEEEAFPRGGGDELTPLERRKITQEALAAVERESLEPASKKARKSKAPSKAAKENKAEDEFFSKESVHGKVAKYVELLKVKTLSVGMKLLGMVLEISNKQLIISLPHGLRGHVEAAEASDTLSLLLNPNSKQGTALRAALAGSPPPSLPDLFHIGQFVHCTVVGLTGDGQGGDGQADKGDTKRNRIQLSLQLKKVCSGLDSSAVRDGAVLPACVRSVEDHGYSLTFGIKGASGFLPKRDFATHHGPEARLLPGSLITCTVTSAEDLRTVAVTSNPSNLGAPTADWEGVTLGSLLPGTLVNAKVRNVLSDGLLVSFLTYFHGTIDPFHLPQTATGGDWQSAFSAESNTKLRARIMYVDPVAKKVGLTLQPHLLSWRMPTTIPMIGQVFESAAVKRVDAGVGLLMGLEDGSDFGMGYVHVSNVSEERIEKLDKVYKPGRKLKVRVIGYRLMDNLATLSAKESVVSASALSYADLVPGQLAEGTVSKVLDRGMVVDLGGGLKGFVGPLHLSSAAGTQAGSTKKFKVGQKVQGRILEVNPSEKKVQLTLKSSLVKSKLPVVNSLNMVAPGTKAHGVVTGVKNFGIFIGFYGGVTGLAHVSELGLVEGQAPEKAFQVGQVLRCRVVSLDPQQNRLKLSLVSKKGQDEEMGHENGEDGGATPVAADPLGGLQAGDLVAGTVAQVEEADGKTTCVLQIEVASGTVIGRLDEAHLSDHPAAAEALKEVLKGVRLEGLMVVQRVESGAGKGVILTRKASLISAKDSLPKRFEDVKATSVLPGYVASVTKDSVFVRFLNGITGRAPLAQLADTFVSDPKRIYQEGQSVRGQVVVVDSEKQRFSLTLKPSLTAANDASYLATLFRDTEVAEKLCGQDGEEDGDDIDWDGALSIGSVVDGTVHQRQDFGLVCDLAANEDLVGVVETKQAQGGEELGAAIKGRVLDVSKEQGIVDISLLPRHVKLSKKKPKLKVGSEVEVEVELTKAHYCVVSLPTAHNAIGFLSFHDFNSASDMEANKKLATGQKLMAVVKQLPEPSSGNRLLLLPKKSSPQAAAAASNGMERTARGKLKHLIEGCLVDAVVVSAHPLHLDVKAGKAGLRARVHITEVVDFDQKVKGNPLEPYTPNQTIQAAVLGEPEGGEAQRHYVVDLSFRPSAVKDAKDGTKKIQPVTSWAAMKPGMKVQGYVQEVGKDHLWVMLSAVVRGRVGLMDAVDNLTDVERLAEVFKVGQPVQARVLQVDTSKHRMDLSLRAASGAEASTSAPTPADSKTPLHVKPGSLVIGRVTNVSGGGIRVDLGHRAVGRAALTDIHDVYVANALKGLAQGAYVKALVVEVDTDGRAVLSLRPSVGGQVSGQEPELDGEEAPESLGPSDVKEGEVVQGYVKRVDKGGVFVVLGRGLEARVKLKDLAAGFVEDPAKMFPEGKLVKGRIISVDGNRVELSLKSLVAAGGWKRIEELEEGEVVTGRVRKVAPFGVFVDISSSGLVGLCHISEVADTFVKDIDKMFQPGQAVRAKVLRMDKEKGKVSLTMKSSAIDGTAEEGEGKESDEEMSDAENGGDIEDQLMAAADEEGEEDEDEEGSEEVDEGSDGEEEGDIEAAFVKAIESGEEDEDEQGSDGEDEEEEDSDGDAEGSGSEEEDERPSGSGSEEDEEPGSSGRAHSTWPGLQLDNGGNAAGSDDEDDDSEDEGGEKLSKAQKRRKKQDKELRIRQAELARLQGDQAPKTAADFDRLLMASPNSSYVWIKYMAHEISLGEIDRARALAEQALERINFREQGEKFNVWVAWLNLENMYGSPPEEAVMKLFGRALQYTDQKKLYLALLGIFQRTSKDELASQLLKSMCKKFGSSAKVWLTHVEHHLTAGSGDDARKTLDRSLSSLPQRKHLKVLSKAAVMEFRIGSAERGRGMFESILRNHPKRLDLWSVYIDQEIKLGDKQRIRALFERATHMQLPPKKMKFLFKRFLEFEKKHGDAASVEHVKKAAMLFIESTMVT